MTQASPDPADDDQATLIAWLSTHDVPCPACNYNLRALTSPRCPECGNDLRLSVALADPYIKAWITLAVAVCGSAGMGLLFFCIFLRAGLPHEGLIDFAIIYFILMSPTPIILLRTRRRYLRLPRDSQWTISLIIAGVTPIAIGILCAGLR